MYISAQRMARPLRTVAVGKPPKHLVVGEQVLVVEAQVRLVEGLLLGGACVSDPSRAHVGVRAARLLGGAAVGRLLGAALDARRCSSGGQVIGAEGLDEPSLCTLWLQRLRSPYFRLAHSPRVGSIAAQN